MKIAYTGVNLPEGKVKYQDPVVIALSEKFDPKKISPYFFEFLPDAYESAQAIVISEDSLLDLLILDIEKIETRLTNMDDNDSEVDLMKRCMEHLESNSPLCEMDVTEEDSAVLNAWSLLSFNPVLVVASSEVEVDDICERTCEKAGMMFFYTAGKQEVHAWLVRNGDDAVTCAGKIHSDLARGFIKAELVSFDDMMTAHNMNDARDKGLTRLVDKSHIVEKNQILDIRFNV